MLECAIGDFYMLLDVFFTHSQTSARPKMLQQWSKANIPHKKHANIIQILLLEYLHYPKEWLIFFKP